jgi:formylglycine-generating enzyme required for sulfatase activity
MKHVLAALLAVVLWASPTIAQGKRVAFVVGNSTYKHAGQLDNPMNDAVDMSAILKQKGFTVIEGMDLDKAAFIAALQDFSSALKGAEIAVFFYAGHGVQVDGQNYLVPVDAMLATATALDAELVPVNVIYREMEGKARFKIVILDACRNNPLADELRKAMGQRSHAVGRGLAGEDLGLGWESIISFSTQPGNLALDGDGRNSPFAAALVRNLATSNRDVDVAGIFAKVRSDVMQATRSVQIPWDLSSLRVRLYLDRSLQPEVNAATLAWSKVNRQSYREVEAFVERYGASPEGERARLQLAIPACISLKGGGGRCIKVAGSTSKPLARVVIPSFRDCPDCPEMVIVPWGHFHMGSPHSEIGRDPGEEQHRITIPFHFAVGRLKVTVDEWSACVAAGGCRASSATHSQGSASVADISFEDARSYARWLSTKTGKSYRLPSEAEWEFVKRAGTTTAYWWGSSMDARPAAGSSNPWDIRSDSPEWVEDCWNESIRAIESDGRARTTGDCSHRVVRGSSDDHPAHQRSAYRTFARGDEAGIGFRVVNSLLDR